MQNANIISGIRERKNKMELIEMKKGSHHTKKTILKMKKHKFTDLHRERISEKAKLRTGEKNSFWHGGRKILDGYIYVRSPDHPYATKQGYVLLHRMLMEKHLGRILLPTEVCHHINNKRQDNQIENLMLFSSDNKHMQIHNMKRNRDENGRFKN
jgi:hypothetical protein